MAYEEFDAPPDYVLAQWKNGEVLNKDAPVKWSGNDRPPPAVGSEILITMNQCGPAVVTGYFVEDGWLGVRCRLLNPPAWHVAQNKGDPAGHVFGPELKTVTAEEADALAEAREKAAHEQADPKVRAAVRHYAKGLRAMAKRLRRAS